MCGGSGTTRHKHIANGDCFGCWGSGKVNIARLTQTDWYKMHVSAACYSVDRAVFTLMECGREVARECIPGIVRELFKLGTEGSREVLARLASGRVYNDNPDRNVKSGWVTVPAADAQWLRAEIIAAGREAVAAQGK